MAASVGEHARLPAGSIIQDRFSVLHELGCGNFAKVYCCRDTKRASQSDPELVAVKVLKKEYANDARFEADILKAITTKNASQRHSVLTMLDHFQWGRYPVFVFPLKGPTLRQRRMGVTRGACTPDNVRTFAYEMLRALAFLHFDVKMIHTDLKPENILVESNAGAGGIGEKWTIADFGSASFYRPEKLDADLISTRPYRAPEVVLGGSWFYAADVWSMACIIYEVFAGSRLFDVHDDLTHLSQMEGRLGAFPESMTSNLRHSRRFFSSAGKLMGRASTTATRPLGETVRDDPLLADLLAGMLAYDPKQRTRADHALEHPYFAPIVAGKRGSTPRSASVSPSSATLPPAAPRRVSADAAVGLVRALPASRAASPLLPVGPPMGPVTTNSYTALKYSKLRRGMVCAPPMPLSVRSNAIEAAL